MSYLGVPPFGQTVRTVTSQTANGSQTTFYPTGGYTVGYLDVFYNGVRVVEATDYTAGDGNSVTFAAAPTSNAVIEMVSYGPISFVDAVARSGDTLGGTFYVRDLIPAANNTYSLGNSSYRFANLYLSGNTIVLGNSTISANATSITFANSTGGAAEVILSNTGVVANTYGDANNIPIVTVDAQGRVSSITLANTLPNYDTAYANAVAYANTKAAAAYANVFNGGTFTGAVTMQANLTANTVRLNGSMQIDGDLIVSGNTVTMNVSSLAVEDNMIYLNASSNVANPDLGIAGNYNDGTYRHAGMFRDATDGVWKFFHQYVPEPDASAYIDTSNNTFALANVQGYAFISGGGGIHANGTLTANATTITGSVSVTGNTILVGTLTANSITVGNSTVNTVIINNSINVTANNWAWPSTIRPINLGNWASFVGDDSNKNSAILHNCYYDSVRGQWVRKNTGYASFIGHNDSGQQYFYISSNTDLANTSIGWTNPLLINPSGTVLINTSNSTFGGFNNKLIVKQSNNAWYGGIGVEAAANDHVLTMGCDATSTSLTSSYRSSAGYKPLILRAGGYDAINIDTSGRVQMPYQICVQCGAPGATYSSGSSYQHWGQSGYVFQNQGSGWNASTGIFTSPISATYMVTIKVRFSSESYSSSGNYNYLQLVNTNTSVNGTPIFLWSPASYTGGTYRPYMLTAIIKLNTNDTITPRLYIYGGGSVTCDGGTTGQTDDQLSIIQIG